MKYLLAFCVLFTLLICKRIDPNHPAFQYTAGRIDFSNPLAPRFDWPNIYISTRFTGKSLSVLFKDSGNNGFNIFVDGNLTVIFPSSRQTKYVISNSLSPQKTHSLLITKRTEAHLGISTFLGIEIDDDATVAKPDKPAERRIEFFGDSLTAGYGNEGLNHTCPFTKYTENSYLTYAALTARALNAEYNVQAWSGKGLVRNYGSPNTTSPDPLPIYVNRTLANEKNNIWKFTWIPHAFVVYLGTNDYSTKPRPPPQVFKEGYKKLLDFLFSKYPKATAFCMCMNFSSVGPLCSIVQEFVKEYKGNVHYLEVPANALEFPKDYGCSAHPNVKGHEKMAAIVIPKIREIMKW